MRPYQCKLFGLLSALLVGAGMSATPALAADGETKQDFTKYDSDKDGYISLQEFQSQKKNEKAFKEADADRDGRLNQDEFIKARSIDQRMQAGEFIDDAWITTKVKALLLKEDALSALKIDVDTKDGVVRLSGQVDKSEQVARAVEVASKVAGVKRVQTDLTLKK
jgi:hyperosmotically inducible protein